MRLVLISQRINCLIITNVYSNMILNDLPAYICVKPNGVVEQLSYDEAQAKIQHIREHYKEMEIKSVDEETIISELEEYK